MYTLEGASTDGRVTPSTTSILIVDDHQSFGDLLFMALTGEPDLEVCGVSTSADEAVAECARLNPDLIVMDIQMSRTTGGSGLDATRQIRRMTQDVVIVVASAHNDPEWVARAAAAGADGFVPKSGSFEQILSVLRLARRGSPFLVPSLMPGKSSTITRLVPETRGLPQMTSRETEVLRLIASGLSPSQAANLLRISVHTCRGYLKSIHRKLGVSSQVQAIIRARELGLLEASG